MTPADLKKHFALFVSSVEGHLVTRYGSNPRENIGASRTIVEVPTRGGIREDATLAWHTERVIAISHAEFRRYRREYEQALATGALKQRSADDYLAHQKDEEDAGAKKLAAEKAAPTPITDPEPSDQPVG